MALKPGGDAFAPDTYARLLALARRWVRDRAIAEDLAQAAYAAVLRDARFDRTRPDAAGYLLRKARWLAQDHRRRSARAAGPLPEGLADPRVGQPDAILERGEVRALVRLAVTQLPENLRAVLDRH